MRPIQQRVNGHLFQKKEQTLLLLAEGGPSVYLRFAFVRRGVETNLFPSFLLDDWGSELRGLELYRWIDEFGEQFPRAEVFGFTQEGKELQSFLRDIEIYVRLPVFAFADKDSSLTAGVQITSLVRRGEGAAVEKVKRPAGLKSPLKRAALSWWTGDREAILAAGFEPFSLVHDSHK